MKIICNRQLFRPLRTHHHIYIYIHIYKQNSFIYIYIYVCNIADLDKQNTIVCFHIYIYICLRILILNWLQRNLPIKIKSPTIFSSCKITGATHTQSSVNNPIHILYMYIRSTAYLI